VILTFNKHQKGRPTPAFCFGYPSVFGKESLAYSNHWGKFAQAKIPAKSRQTSYPNHAD